MAWNASARPADIPSLMSQMQKNYSTMNQLYQRLGAESSRQERAQLTKLRTDTKDLAAQIKTAISQDQSPKMIHDKYVSDFGKMMRDFMTLSENISKREASILDEVGRDTQRYSSVPVESLPAARRQTVKDYNAANWQDAEEAMVRETNEELRAIERDLTDLNDMVRTVNTQVAQQGVQVDQVERNTNSAAANVESGTAELSTAAKLANAIRKKKLLIAILCIIICLVIALAVGLPLYFSLR